MKHLMRLRTITLMLMIFSTLDCRKVAEAPEPRVLISGPRMMMGATVGRKLTHYTINVLRCDGCVVTILARGYATNDAGNIADPIPFREHRTTKTALHTISYPLYLTRGKWFIKTVLFQEDQVVATNDFMTEVRDE